MNTVYCVLVDRDGRRLITGSDDQLVKIWSLSDGFARIRRAITAGAYG